MYIPVYMYIIHIKSLGIILILMTITLVNGSSGRPQKFGLKIHDSPILQCQLTLPLKKNPDFSTSKKGQF